MNKTYLITLALSLVFITLAFVLQGQLSHFRFSGLAGIFLINLFGSATLFVPAPAIISVFAGGFLFPPITVALVAAMGSVVGDMVGFFLGKSGKKVFFSKKNPYWYKKIRSLFKNFADIAIFLFAFIPNPLFDGVGIVAGALNFSLIRFFILVLLGRIMRNIFIAYGGSLLALH